MVQCRRLRRVDRQKAMPIYEYWCLSCRKKSSFFVRTITSSLDPVCQSCGSTQMERAVSGFAYQKSAQTLRDQAADPYNPPGDYYNDPRNVGRWVEQTWQETMGDEPLPEEIHEMIETAREGDLPEPPAGMPEFPDPLQGL